MATRFRLTSDATAPAVSPTGGTYTHDQGTRRKLNLTDTSTLTTSAYTPDAADDLVAGDARHIQFVSNPLTAGAVFTSGDTLKFCVQGTEAHANNNIRAFASVYVYDSAGTTLRATLRSIQSSGPAELPGTLNSRFFSTTLTGSYTLVADDRLVVDFYVSGTPTAAGGVQGHNGSIRWGSGGAAGDLLENDTQTGTTLDPWIEFATTVTEAAGPVTQTVTDVDGLVDSAAQNADYAPLSTDNLGLVDSAAQVAASARDLTDPLGLVDSSTQATDHARDLTDILGLVDDATYEATGTIERTVTDPLGMVDVGLVDIYYPADPLGLADAGSAELSRDADNLGLSDDVTAALGGSSAQTFTDPLGITFSGQVDIYYEADPLSLADDIEAVAASDRTVTDPVGLVDDASYQVTSGAVNHTATITDSLGLVDSVTAAVGVNVSVVDSLGLVDAATTVTGFTFTVVDGVGLVDSVTTTATYSSTVTDLLGLTDSMSSQVTGSTFWVTDPTGYTANPVPHTKTPVDFVKVGPGDTPPWN